MLTALPWALHADSSENRNTGDVLLLAASEGCVQSSFSSWYAARIESPSSKEVTDAVSSSLDVSGELEPWCSDMVTSHHSVDMASEVPWMVSSPQD